MEFMKLIITLISCEDLRCPYTNKPIKKNAMATIRTPAPSGQVFTTTIDTNNGSYPNWNEKFRVEMPVNAHWFDVEVRRGMDTLIGVARVPVSDFVNRLVPVGYLNFLSYRLQAAACRHGGFIRGIVNISVRIIPNISKDKIRLGRQVAGGLIMGKADREDGASVSAYGYGGRTDDIGMGVVTGIPVTYGMDKKMRM